MVFFIVFVLAINIVISFQSNSSNYKLSPIVVSGGGGISNSSSYKNYIASGMISGITNSSTYKNLIGFFHTWLLADNQPCTADNQCGGGYCCSNVCSSSACPVPEDPVTPSSSGGEGGGGGGRGGFIAKEEDVKNFIINLSSIKTRVGLGKSSSETLKITNNGDGGLEISLKLEGIDDYLSLSQNIFNLEEGKSKGIILNFIGKRVGSFSGQIIVNSGEIEKTIPVIVEIVSENILFDIKLDVPAKNSILKPGDELKGQITILNVGAPEDASATINYIIKDLMGEIIYRETEVISIKGQISYPKSFRIPNNLEEGEYIITTEVKYGDSFSVSSQFFSVEKKSKLNEIKMIAKNKKTLVIVAAVLVGLTALSMLKPLKFKNKKTSKKRPGKRKKEK